MLVDILVNRTIEASANKERCLITLAGIPGAGKTTTGLAVANELTKRGIESVVVGMDGYHYTREELTKRIGAEKAAKFRGAPYTFDAPGVKLLAQKLSEPGTEVRFPTFDHAVKDPIADGGHISSSTKVVILEGLYLHLKDKEWRGIMDFAADTWFAEIDMPTARKRLAKRHLESGIVDTLEQGELRADTNDLVNGDYIIKNSYPAAYQFRC